MKRILLLVLLAGAMAGCASKMPVIRKQAVDFKSTALFKLPCAENVPPGEYEMEVNRCNSTHMARMVERFMLIREADEGRGIPGDTIDEVRLKGFTIYADPEKKARRANTRVLYGNEALAAAGMGVSPPPLQKPEEIKAYADFMAQHYAEEYIERDMTVVADRLCINNRETLEFGDDRVFAIVWRGGHVFKRIIKGGPVNNPKHERAFLLCPAAFITDTLTGTVSNTVRTVTPVPR